MNEAASTEKYGIPLTYKRHWLLSWGGTLAFGLDIWANNVRFTNDETGQPDSIPGSTLEGMLDDFVSDIRTFMTSPNSYINNGVSCTYVKFNEIGPDGRYVDTANTHARYLSGSTGSTAVINGVNSTAVPAYQSVAITTTTAAQRGPGSKGRLFLPQCAAPLTAQGFITSAAQTALTNQSAAFFTALGDEAGVDVTNMRPAVVSNVGAPGPARVITGVKVGSVPDVITRRKNGIAEAYTSATVS